MDNMKDRMKQVNELYNALENAESHEDIIKFNEKLMEDYPVMNEGDFEWKLPVGVMNKSTNELPEYENEHDSGFDLRANLNGLDKIIVEPLRREIIPTGLHFEIPPGYELQVRSRSGLAFNHGIMVLNSPGTVDAGYRGEVKVILMNLGNLPFVVEHGDRIAQGVISAVLTKNTMKLEEKDKLSDTDRGTGGFGSTGVK